MGRANVTPVVGLTLPFQNLKKKKINPSHTHVRLAGNVHLVRSHGLGFACERRAQRSQTEKVPALKGFLAVLGETPPAHQSLVAFVSLDCTHLCTERDKLPSARGRGTPGATAKRPPSVVHMGADMGAPRRRHVQSHTANR